MATSNTYSWYYILGQEDKVEVDESLFDDLDLDAEEFDDDSEDER